MTVLEAISMLSYGTSYEIKGSYSGKIYHRSWINKKEHAEKFFNETVSNEPFYCGIRANNTAGLGTWCSPVIGIWMHDYHIAKKGDNKK